MRVVVDANVLVSGLISPHGTPAAILRRWLDGQFTLLYSPALYEEYEDVLHRAWLHERLAGSPNLSAAYLEAIASLGEPVIGYADASGQVRDPFDEALLACALLGNADYLVTARRVALSPAASGDRDLLSLSSFRNTAIVTPAAFLAVLGALPPD